MAEKTNVKLPEDVAAAFKYVGNGHTKFIVGGRRLHLESISLADAEQYADKVFLKKKPQPKAAKGKPDTTEEM